MKQIVIKFIAHDDQRIGEPADWWFDENDDLQVRITDMGDWKFNVCCGRHEMDEALFCRARNISQEQVDEYCAIDDSELGNIDPDSFSGYPKSPHQVEHNDALSAEWIFSRLLGVDWKEYGKAFSTEWDKKHA